jgi:hypothetical protein
MLFKIHGGPELKYGIMSFIIYSFLNPLQNRGFSVENSLKINGKIFLFVKKIDYIRSNVLY